MDNYKPTYFLPLETLKDSDRDIKMYQTYQAGTRNKFYSQTNRDFSKFSKNVSEAAKEGSIAQRRENSMMDPAYLSLFKNERIHTELN